MDGRINLVEALNFSDPFTPDIGMGWVCITDVDPQDGMDDLWQLRHGITSAQALEDPDGDGRTNMEESIVGSPLQTDNAWGERTGAPIPEGPGSFTVALKQTAPGMRYQLEWSDDRFDFTSSTVGDEGVAKISGGGPYEEEPVLRFAVYPRRTLKVTVHPITLLYPNGTVRSAPQHVPIPSRWSSGWMKFSASRPMCSARGHRQRRCRPELGCGQRHAAPKHRRRGQQQPGHLPPAQ